MIIKKKLNKYDRFSTIVLFSDYFIAFILLEKRVLNLEK